MTKKELNDMTGAELLRLIVSNINATNESFNDEYSLEELIQIHRMFLLSEWDIYPDCWTKRQIKEALQGIPPQWTKNERPKYSKIRSVVYDTIIETDIENRKIRDLENKIEELKAELHCATHDDGPES